jgi:hypothetical protein
LIEIGILNIGRVLARALALLDRKAPADQKRITIAQATAGIQVRIGTAVLWPSKFLLILSPETPVPLPQNIEKRTAVGQNLTFRPAICLLQSRHSTRTAAKAR